ncbi:helix-turn-helix domain-containing protein [Paenibacillus hexagrammi]|uniref:Helix-turn-helix domain-containing protein n=1 Tax=Paenibacillus hexagrammi TaxID=2908839 RepID=A0ABY3SLM7_9BACL|nr:helix-turn-helix transcriptional regulator [Paenibacillus sp. YPD9-1]UJF34958.1 helix-turn-helix domain-containing protein [Paenibacillus sp. YPD9-1]
MTFGERLQELRKEREMSQRKLSDKSGVSYSLLNAMEVGERTPTREAILSLARALQCQDADELLRLAGYE